MLRPPTPLLDLNNIKTCAQMAMEIDQDTGMNAAAKRDRIRQWSVRGLVFLDGQTRGPCAHRAEMVDM